MIPINRQLKAAPLKYELAAYGIRLAPEYAGLRSDDCPPLDLTKPFIRYIRIGDEIIPEPIKTYEFNLEGSLLFPIASATPDDAEG